MMRKRSLSSREMKGLGGKRGFGRFSWNAVIDPIYRRVGVIDPVYQEVGVIDPIYRGRGVIDPIY